MRTNFTALDFIVLIAYLLGTTALGIFLGRNQKDAKDYFVAGHTIPWWAVLFSVVATETSALTFISIPGLAYTTDLGFLRLQPEAFARAPLKSIDYAVMEKTDRAAVVAGDFCWSDIGSWDALFDITPPDAAGNVVHGPAVTLDATGCVLHSDGQLVTAIGVKDLVVVSTSDAVMVVPRSRAQEVKELVAKLKADKRPEATDHKRVHRPWGYYESIDMGERFQVKRIVVIPGGVLSLQKHRHRAEHWVVVHGTAEVTIGDTVRAVHENESVYIPIGSVHRMANRGKIPLELIEVQTGSYLGEDDIERIEDIYKRR